MDRVDKAKLESLIAEIRSWPPGEVRSDAENLARRYRLDPMIVKRVAEAEGVVFEPSKLPSPAAATSSTEFLRVDDLEKFERDQGSD